MANTLPEAANGSDTTNHFHPVGANEASPLLAHACGTLARDESDKRLSDAEIQHYTHEYISKEVPLVTDIESYEEDEKEAILTDSEFYLHSTMLQRALPERQFALMVTLLFEVPVLFVTCGSYSLCQLVGRAKYHLLMGFIP